MVDINELRQTVKEVCWPTSPFTVDELLELLDRLEAAESARRDDYQNWMTALDRNAELLAKLEAAEKERDALRAELKEIRYGVAVAHDTIKALRAKIGAMERQVPICRAEDLKHAESLLPMLGLKPENHLYALPGAQPAPSAPDGWQLVPEEVLSLYNYMCVVFVPMTPQQEEIAIQLGAAKRAMLAAAPKPEDKP